MTEVKIAMTEVKKETQRDREREYVKLNEFSHDGESFVAVQDDSTVADMIARCGHSLFTFGKTHAVRKAVHEACVEICCAFDVDPRNIRDVDRAFARSPAAMEYLKAELECNITDTQRAVFQVSVAMDAEEK